MSKFPRSCWFKVWPQLGKGAATSRLIWESCLETQRLFCNLGENQTNPLIPICCLWCFQCTLLRSNAMFPNNLWTGWLVGHQLAICCPNWGCGVGNSYIGRKDINILSTLPQTTKTVQACKTATTLKIIFMVRVARVVRVRSSESVSQSLMYFGFSGQVSSPKDFVWVEE